MSAQLWIKLGWRRLDWIRNLLIAIAVLGIVMVFDAVAFPPGLTFECGPLYNTTTIVRRTPLRAVFLLDASGSVVSIPGQFESELKAAQGIIDAFTDVYQPQTEKLYVGVAQFSSSARVDIDITNDLDAVRTQLAAIQPSAGGTDFTVALEACAQALTAHTLPGGEKSYDLCVLITDGEDGSGITDYTTIIGANTHLMGIYVGKTSLSREKLQDFTCGVKNTCPFFGSAEDFSKLQDVAKNLARAIGSATETNTDVTDVIYPYKFPTWTLILLVLLIPFLCWWTYLRIPDGKVEVRTEDYARKDPVRLLLAGRNEETPPPAPPPEMGRGARR